VKRAWLSVVVWLVTLLLALPEPVAAYLDPGAGSMLLQGLIAVVAATLAAAGAYWRTLRGVIRRMTNRQAESTPHDPDRP
jgi:hypothetical protein